MENNENELNQNEGQFQPNIPEATNPTFELTPMAIEFLREAAKWAKFLAIVAFIGLGLSFVASFFVGAMLSMIPSSTYPNDMPAGFGTLYMVMMLIIVAIYVFPVWYLLKFSDNLQKAINFKNNQYLETSFKFLKSHYKFIGILMIVMIAFYILMFIFGIIGGLLTAAGSL